MALTKNDLEAISQIVDERLDKKLDERLTKTETNLKDYVDYSLGQSENRINARFDKVEANLSNKINELDIKIDDVKNQLSREVSDLSAINRMFIEKSDNHEERIVRIENKLDIKAI